MEPSSFRTAINPVASGLLAIAAGVLAVAYGGTATGIDAAIVTEAAGLGLAAGFVYSLVNGFFDRPALEARGLFDIRSLNVMPFVLALGIVAGLIVQVDPAIRVLLFAGLCGAGVANALGLLFWRVRRGRF